MTIEQIVFFAFAAPVFMWGVSARMRPWGLMVGSLLAALWWVGGIQVATVDVILSLLLLGLIVSVWWLVQPTGDHTEENSSGTITTEDGYALVIMTSVLLLLGGFALMQTDNLSIAVLPVLGVVTLGIGANSLSQIAPSVRDQLAQSIAWLLIILIICLLVSLKLPALATFWGELLRWDTTSVIADSPIVWIGFSYVAFRIMAVLLDYRAGRLAKQGYSLRDLTVYVLFFPAFTAGPIDRAGRFIPELNQPQDLSSARLVEGSTRIAVGLFKKFVIADSLALVSMSPALIDQTETTLGLWVLLYLYAFQIYFDFSGYSDVAIGLGRLYGITLPENFDRPYIQPNVQQFWQRWHMTLSTWFRVYYFTPFSRLLIRSSYRPPQFVIILLSQVTTMALIGLWHGITVNFFLWGVWHGVGLFLHKMLADNTRGWHKRVTATVWPRRIIYVGSVFVTFHFVAIGWVFFALPGPEDSLTILTRLFGVGG